ncbi:DUF2535 family protein [Neobacillus bataviensis]|uniref:DUF2535 family protein n=1 Tax=Neobacillus bataviensis TaxID=220685 RepID=UPI001CBC6432|nr:DUF2535 family protein [Neobacillus bataviensis]
MLFKSLEFKNSTGQKIKIVDIPVVDKNNPYFFMMEVRLESFILSLNKNPQEKSCYSFRDYLKPKMRWPDFKKLFSLHEFKNNA